MNITVNKKEVSLNFGIKFVRELDKINPVKSGDMDFGMSLTRTIPALQAGDPVAFADVLYSATFDNKKRPSLNDIEDFLDNADEKELDSLSKEVLENLYKSSVLKRAIQKMS